MKITISQCIEYCRQAGFPESSIPTAVGIAICESQLETTAQCHNCVPGILENSQGLWQINVNANPEFADQNLLDPATNAAAAYLLSNRGTNFKPWSTFNDGCCAQYAAQVVVAMQSPVNVTVNGSSVPTASAYTLNGASFGWIRPLAVALSAQIVDFSASTVNLEFDGEEAVLAATTTSGKAFIHLADLSRLPGVSVTWDAGTKTVAIASESARLS